MTSMTDAYGLMSMNGEPTPACLAKQLFAQHVRYGDWIRFPRRRLEAPDVDAVVAWRRQRPPERCVRQHGEPAAPVTVADWDDELSACREVLRLDSAPATGGPRAVRRYVRINGYGIAVVTDATAGNPGRLRPASSA